MIILGKAEDYTLEQIVLMSSMPSIYKYFEDYRLYQMVRNYTNSVCDMAYKEVNRELYLNNLGLPLQEKVLIVPKGYKITKEIERNYDIEILEGGHYG